MAELFRKSLEAHIEVFDRLIEKTITDIETCADAIWKCLAAGGKVLLCGNGGSAADAQHIAAEFVGRYESERRAYPSIALTTDTSALTAIGNDYGFDSIFARQVEALAQKGDILIAISTSGNSPNVLTAIQKGKERGCTVIGLTGRTGGKMRDVCDHLVVVPAEKTSRIQEAHITIGHLWCEYFDAMVAARDQAA